MSLATTILSILGSGLALFLGWYFKDIFRAILQRYQDYQNEQLAKKARTDAQALNQKANADSDKLKKIDGR